jgi:hypothetical protein
MGIKFVNSHNNLPVCIQIIDKFHPVPYSLPDFREFIHVGIYSAFKKSCQIRNLDLVSCCSLFALGFDYLGGLVLAYSILIALIYRLNK